MVLSRNVLIYLSSLYFGEWNPIYEHITAHKELCFEKVNEIASQTKFKCLTYLDDEYPTCFYDIYRPPLVLYYEGNLSLLNKGKRIVSIAGSLDIEPDTVETIREVVNQVCENKDISILSTVARGSQVTATRAAIEKGRCILMLASGIDRPTNSTEAELIRSAKQKGLVISQYPPGTEATPLRARTRNQVIAQAGDFLLICSSHPHDPVFEMAAIAVQKGKEIGCLPYRAKDGNANNTFLKDGACLVTSGEDILFDLGLSNQPFPNE